MRRTRLTLAADPSAAIPETVLSNLFFTCYVCCQNPNGSINVKFLTDDYDPHTTSFREIKFGSEAFRQECGLRDEVLRKPIGRSLYDEDLAGENNQLHFGLFIAEDLIACVIALPLSAKQVKIRQMAVSPGAQAKGFGKRIIEELEIELVERGFTELQLHARISAAEFYLKLGYTRIGAEFTEVGLPHIKMHKNLTL